MITAVETEKDGAMGQVKAMDTDSIDKDENKAKKDMEDSKENSKEETKADEIILTSNTQSLHCSFATPAARTGAEGVPAGLCGPSGIPLCQPTWLSRRPLEGQPRLTKSRCHCVCHPFRPPKPEIPAIREEELLLLRIVRSVPAYICLEALSTSMVLLSSPMTL